MDSARLIIRIYLGMLGAGTLCYILAGGIFLVSWTADCSLGKAAFEFTSALGTVGLSNGLTASAPNAALWVEMAGMLIGRLEWVVVFVSLYSLCRTLRNRRP